MTNGKNAGFSHIKVGGGSFDEDDEVIVAGIPASAPVEADSDPSFDTSFADVAGQAAFGRESASPAPAPVEEAFVEIAPARSTPAESAPAKDAPRKKKETRDEYRETTLEDLESTKMSGMQLVLILAAIVLVVVAAAYIVMH